MAKLDLLLKCVERLSPAKNLADWRSDIAKALSVTCEKAARRYKLSSIVGGAVNTESFIPDKDKDRRRFHTDFVRYQAAWALSGRLKKNKSVFSLEELGPEIGMSKDWKTSVDNNRINPEMMALAFTSVHMDGNQTIKMSTEDIHVHLALTFAFINFTRAKLAQLEVATPEEMKNKNKAITRSEFTILDWLEHDVDSSDLKGIEDGDEFRDRRIELPEKIDTSLVGLRSLESVWKTSFSVARLMAEVWARPLLNLPGAEDDTRNT